MLGQNFNISFPQNVRISYVT